MYDVNLKIVDRLIFVQKSSLKHYLIFTIGVVLLGFSLIVLSQVLDENDYKSIKTILFSGGTLIISFSGFSFKEFLEKKENINLFETYKMNIEIFKDDIQKQNQFESSLQNYLFKR